MSPRVRSTSEENSRSIKYPLQPNVSLPLSLSPYEQMSHLSFFLSSSSLLERYILFSFRREGDVGLPRGFSSRRREAGNGSGRVFGKRQMFLPRRGTIGAPRSWEGTSIEIGLLAAAEGKTSHFRERASARWPVSRDSSLYSSFAAGATHRRKYAIKPAAPTRVSRTFSLFTREIYKVKTRAPLYTRYAN